MHVCMHARKMHACASVHRGDRSSTHLLKGSEGSDMRCRSMLRLSTMTLLEGSSTGSVIKSAIMGSRNSGCTQTDRGPVLPLLCLLQQQLLQQRQKKATRSEDTKVSRELLPCHLQPLLLLPGTVTAAGAAVAAAAAVTAIAATAIPAAGTGTSSRSISFPACSMSASRFTKE